MIKIKIKGGSSLPETVAKLDREYPLNTHCLWIGRGEQLHQKQNQQSHVLNLGDLSQSVSRIHACLLFSPAFRTSDSSYPTYFNRLPQRWSSLPQHLLFLVWEFARPARKIVLKDVHSKTGVYRKVQKAIVLPGMEIVLGESRPLLFHHQEIYDSCEQMSSRLQELTSMGYSVLNQLPYSHAQSFWIMSFKQQFFILKNQPSRLFIGRSSSCQLPICQASISRRHATLQYLKNEWTLSDGDGSQPSSNGVWQRIKRCEVDCHSKEWSNWSVKIADVLFIMEVREDHSSLNLSELWMSHKSSSFSELKRENEATFITKESGTVL